jgi:hypothetical protein
MILRAKTVVNNNLVDTCQSQITTYFVLENMGIKKPYSEYEGHTASIDSRGHASSRDEGGRNSFSQHPAPCTCPCITTHMGIFDEYGV